MARPKTVTTQYIVLFSHRIVQLPGGVRGGEGREGGREGGREREEGGEEGREGGRAGGTVGEEERRETQALTTWPQVTACILSTFTNIFLITDKRLSTLKLLPNYRTQTQ